MTLTAARPTPDRALTAQVQLCVSAMLFEANIVKVTIDNNADERDRITALGGEIAQAADLAGNPGGPLRAWPGGVAVARTIGDSDCSTKEGVLLVSHIPAFWTVDMPRGR